MGNNFGFSTIRLNNTFNANVLSSKECFRRIFELMPVRSPNYDCKNLIGVGLVKIEKSRLALSSTCVSGTGNLSAYCFFLSYIFFGIIGLYELLFSNGNDLTIKRHKINRTALVKITIRFFIITTSIFWDFCTTEKI